MSDHLLAVISDVHGNQNALSAVLDEVVGLRVEQIVCAGDSTGSLMQNQVFRTLNEHDALMIRGNGEKRVVNRNRGLFPNRVWFKNFFAGNRWVYENLEPSTMNLLEFIPDQRIVEVRGTHPIRVVHGSPHDVTYAQGVVPDLETEDSKKLIQVHRIISIEDAVEGLREPVLVCGHTHRPWIHNIEGKLVVNPGSVGNPCDGDPDADYAILSWEKDEWKAELKSISYDLEAEQNLFLKDKTLDELDSYEKTAILGRMTGQDVSLEFNLYEKNLFAQNRDTMDNEEAHVAASRSFDWSRFT